MALKAFRGTVKTSSGERQIEVRATDARAAMRLLESYGRVLYIPHMIAS